ncbi:winged helix-turn-helix transcriptional regulator [Brevibacillus composti]|uniref:Winged helix-turn-helix transcriptional regulator n=1 Tax=Brevibacillus composti TaxID=2796470 RepID=A0A7T5ELK8_9BACL|nr:carbohydrate kinase [Brevibacillus composti]QQE74787.1 winged helix-turn-helix transcriptional regulator [Brevibacillus composti]QUO41872.1 winged helix-turn-helix transcriptional regulator [Brevibacillus composti]
MEKEKLILRYIRENPFISQQELAGKMGISRSAVAGYIAQLTKRGEIKGRAYILREEERIVCIGGANLDRKARAKQEVRLHSSNPVTISESCGGVSRNIAENLGRLGCNVALISCVGEDKEGDWILQETKKHGVDISQVWRLPTQRTGTYTALLDHDGEMVVSLAHMDIYDALTPQMLAERWSHIAAARAVYLDTNLPADCLAYVIERCREEGIPLFVDPVSSAKAEKLPERLDGIDTILPNREEAEILAGFSISSVEDCREASRRIRARGVKQVVITLGGEGIYYQSEEESEHLPPYPTDVVDVTGAGDAFASGLLYGVVNGETLARACRLGMAASALTLSTGHSVSPHLVPERLEQTVNEYEKERS